MKSLRIAMVMGCPFPAAQGTQVLVEQMSRALEDRGHQIHIVAYHFGDPHRSVEMSVHRAKGFPGYHRIRSGPDWRKPILDWNLTRTLLKVVREYDIQVIHAHNYEAPLAAYTVRRKTGVPVVYHAHNMLAEELPTYFRRPWLRSRFASLGYALDQYVPPRGNHCLALTPGIQEAMITRGAAQENTQYIPPAVEPLPCNGNRLFDVPTAIYMGNLDGYQNLDFLLDTWKLVMNSIPVARLIIATHGDGSRFRRRIQRQGFSQYVDIRDHLSFPQALELLSHSHVAVNPRFGWWGFPIKLLNYMETSRPIVSCKGSAQGLHHLKNAWVADNGDYTYFAEGIIELIKNPGFASDLGNAAHRTVREHYAWDKIVTNLEQAYQKVL